MKREPSAIGRKVLRMVVNEMRAIAFEAFDWNVKRWSDKSGVSDQTVYNLMNGTTRFPRFETIVKLTASLGMEIKLHRHKVKLSVKGVKETDLIFTKRGLEPSKYRRTA